MDKIVQTQLMRGEHTIEARTALQTKEFLLLFYGASWDTKSQLIADKISAMLLHYNRHEVDVGSKPRIEAIYCSNDVSE